MGASLINYTFVVADNPPCRTLRKCNRPSVSPLKLDSGHVSDDPAVMANCFVQQFASVFSSSDPYSLYIYINHFLIRYVTVDYSV